MKNTITISEIFGPTIQGEGALMGMPTIFIRTGGCDNTCRWCDTKYASRQSKWEEMTMEQIMKKVVALAKGHKWPVTLTGGNPALQPCGDLIENLRAQHVFVSMETQGTKSASWFKWLSHITFSPKPPSSGNATLPDTLLRCIEAYHAVVATKAYCVKIVVGDQDDFFYAVAIQNRLPKDTVIYLQPLSNNLSLMRQIAEWVIANKIDNVRIRPQLHILMYGRRRGV